MHIEIEREKPFVSILLCFIYTRVTSYDYSRIPPSSNLDKVTVRFDKLINTNLFIQLHGLYVLHTQNFYQTLSIYILVKPIKTTQQFQNEYLTKNMMHSN